MKRAEDWTPLTKNHLGTVTSAKPGSIRSTCGMIDAKYGTRTIAAAENSREPPGRWARRFHIRYAFPHPICGGRCCHAGLSYSGVRMPRIARGQRFG